LDAIVDSGGRKSCDDRIVAMVDDALEQLEASDFLDEGKRLLADLSRLMANRNR